LPSREEESVVDGPDQKPCINYPLSNNLISVLKMEAVCYSEVWYLPTTPHDVITQKTNIDKRAMQFQGDTKLQFQDPSDTHLCLVVGLTEYELRRV
jgi:hypothetical protein